MKRLLSITLSCTFIFGLFCACGKSEETTRKKSEKTKRTTVETDIDDDPTEDTDAPSTTTETTTEAPTTTPPIKIVPSETSNLNFVRYDDGYGYASMEAPENWEVTFYVNDLISYAIVARDKTCPDRSFVFQLLATPFLRSQAAKDFYKMSYLDPSQNPYVINPILDTPTIEAFFSECGEYVSIRNFAKICDIQDTSGVFHEMMEGTCQMDTGNYVKGMFGGWVWDIGYMEAYGIDCGWYNVSMLLMMTAPEEEFTEWMPVLAYMFNSVTFSEVFQQDRNRVWQQTVGMSNYLSQIADQMGDMIMDSWYYSQETSDIISQMQSDATLGRERVVDTDTNDIYYAPPGFADSDPDDQFQPLEENDPRYREGVAGTISY